MSKQSHSSDAERVDAAFNRVLAQEAQAREAVEACRQQAAAILAEAAQTSRRIASRTDQRVQLVHRIADAQVARALAELLPPPDLDSEDTLTTMATTLDAAVAALADEILGTGSPLVP